MRVLITGASGFVGSHLAQLCAREGDDVTGVSREAAPDGVPWLSIRADLCDRAAAVETVRETKPERIYHLAAEASVRRSWSDPHGTLSGNLASTLNVLEAAAAEAPDARALIAGSGEVYGPPEELPVSEEAPLRPQNPYAVSKAACDLLAGFYADARDLHVVRARAFNHAGPGQSDVYVVASFARQIAEAEAAGREQVELLTGDLRPKRDFTDVRDVVRAYRAALELAPPAAYNVCSGRATSVVDILAGLARQTALDVEHRTDSARLRKKEVMEIRGSHERLTAATGWQPEIDLEQTLADALDWWRARLTEKVGS